jgi:hypothetical protein
VKVLGGEAAVGVLGEATMVVTVLRKRKRQPWKYSEDDMPMAR